MDRLPTLLHFCMILDCNNLLVDYYFHNVVLSCFLQTLPEASLCCHLSHLSLPPGPLRWSHIISTKTPRAHSFLIVISCPIATLFLTIAKTHTNVFRSPWIQPAAMREHKLHPQGRRMKNQSPSQFSNMHGILRQELSLAFIIFQ